MTVQVCSCGARPAWGFLRCPRCGTVTALFAGRVKEEAVPKVTVNSGVSNAGVAAPAEAGPVLEIRGEHGPELVQLPAGSIVRPLEQVAQTGPAPAPDYASMTQAALRDEAKTRGLPVGGSKADLAQRLNDHDAAQAEQQEAGA